MQEKLLYHYFDDDDFLRISRKIKEMEKITSGEIRVAIKDSVSVFKKNKSIDKLAEGEFFKLEMDKTRDKTGILIYILLSKRAFYIIADSGIDSKVEQTTWGAIRDDIQNQFKLGHYVEGILSGLEEIGAVLSKHFPIKIDDANELSNKVII